MLPAEAAGAFEVIGPAYIDEVVEVDGALCPAEWCRRAFGQTAGELRIDYSRTEAFRADIRQPDTFLLIESPAGDRIRVTDASAEFGRRVRIAERRVVDAKSLPAGSAIEKAPPLGTEVGLSGRRFQLGGMGAGYALALDARLVLPVGDAAGEPDRDVRRLLELLEEHAVSATPVRVPRASTDTTLLIWSSAGDKLPIGRRRASRAVEARRLIRAASGAPFVVLTSLPNRVVAELARGLSGWTMFTPSLRNAREGGMQGIAGRVDAMSMNRTEWRTCGGEEGALKGCPLVLVTNGVQGVRVHFRTDVGGRAFVEVPAAPAERIVDANHAGEALAAGFLGGLVDLVGEEGLRRGAYRESDVREAAWQGVLAAGSELAIKELAFPSRREVRQLRAAHPLPCYDRGGTDE